MFTLVYDIRNKWPRGCWRSDLADTTTHIRSFALQTTKLQQIKKLFERIGGVARVVLWDGRCLHRNNAVYVHVFMGTRRGFAMGSWSRGCLFSSSLGVIVWLCNDYAYTSLSLGSSFNVPCLNAILETRTARECPLLHSEDWPNLNPASKEPLNIPGSRGKNLSKLLFCTQWSVVLLPISYAIVASPLHTQSQHPRIRKESYFESS